MTGSRPGVVRWSETAVGRSPERSSDKSKSPRFVGLFPSSGEADWLTFGRGSLVGSHRNWQDEGFEVNSALWLCFFFFSSRDLHGSFPATRAFDGAVASLGLQVGFKGFTMMVLDRPGKIRRKVDPQICKTEKISDLLSGSGDGSGCRGWFGWVARWRW